MLAHLHVHTEYSLLDGAIRIGDLIKRAQALGHTAIAVTDHGNLFGAVEFYLKAKGTGVKAILGSEIFHPGSAGLGTCHLVLLAKSLAGYKNLIKVVSDGYLKGLGEVPLVPEASLDEHPGEMIALSSCLRGEFGMLVRALRKASGSGDLLFAPPAEHPAEKVMADLKAHVATMLRRFGEGNYYVELINNGLPEQKAILPDLVAVASHFGLPLVASADAHYLTKDYAEAHAVLMGIKHGLTMSKIRGRRKGTHFHLLDNDEMKALYGAWPEALENTVKIAEQCNVEFKFGQYYLPVFDLGTGESAEDGMARISREMLEERFVQLEKVYGPSFDEKEKQRYRDRLEYEIGVILKMGFAAYFLIVQDFINWAKRNGVPVGPGRGSGAGSLVAYALRITDIDPLPFNLLFERFLNPERVSMPDFDVDFCQDRRDRVIQYVTERYGADQVAQITTFGKMNAKSIVRDVGRVLELGFGRVDRFAKLIPDDLGITLEDAIKQEPKIMEEAARDDGIADLLRYARQLEGLSRHTSVHAAGIVIADGPMVQYVPVYTTETDGLITQFEMKMAEKVGLVKFDFLGLKTLTVIQRAVDIIRAKRNPDFDVALINLEDKKVYKEISAGHCTGIFQLESSGMRNLVMKLKPSCFEDVIALVALFRPGPLGSGMVDDFIERKHGRAVIDYPVPQLEAILKETYGVILYQEQVMKTAGELASYSLGEADLLRRAMGKKIAAEMEKQKVRFVSGAVQNGHPEEKAGQIFDLMAEFANYGFNKSHSAAYGLISYQTAFIKTYYPEEYMAAIMTCDLDNTSKLVRYVDECKRLRIKILPPSLDHSELVFTVPAPKTIDFGLAAIKGIGPQSVEPLIEERKRGGPYKTLADMARRVNLAKVVGKKTLELLIQAGVLDKFGISRPKLLQVIGEVVRFSEQHHTASASGQRGLFDMGAEGEPKDEAATELNWELTVVDKRVGAPDPEWLKKEKALLGVFLTGHPLTFHAEDRASFGKVGTADLAGQVGKRVNMLGVVGFANERLTKTGKRMASVRLEDENGFVEAVMFDKDIPEEFPESGAVVLARGSVDAGFDDRPPRFKLDQLLKIEEHRQEHVRSLTLRLAIEGGSTAKKAQVAPAVALLKAHFAKHEGDVPVRLVLDYGSATAEVSIPAEVDASDAFFYGLRSLPLSGVGVSYTLMGKAAAPAAGAVGTDDIPIPEYGEPLEA